MYSKTQVRIALAYLAFFVVGVCVEKHGLQRGPMTPVEALLAAPIPFGVSVFAIQNGRIPGKFSAFDRDDEPVCFWITVTAGMVVAVLLFGWGALSLLR
jgi:hypothetical protein